jgi:hypothetical protein
MAAISSGFCESLECYRVGAVLRPELNTLHQLPTDFYAVHDLVGLIKTEWKLKNGRTITQWGTASLFRFRRKCDGKFYIGCITAAHNIVHRNYAVMPIPTVTFELRRSGEESELKCRATVDMGANQNKKKYHGAELWKSYVPKEYLEYRGIAFPQTFLLTPS